MSDEVNELVEWLAALLRDPRQASRGKPLWMERAEVTTNLQPASQRVEIACEDGSQYVLLALRMEMSRARREELDREREEQARARREAEMADPELKRKRLEKLRQVVETFRALHYEKHRGRFETCREELCDSVRDLVNILRRGEDDPEDDSGLIDASESGLPS